jgi:GGDEF domain-containing protein
MAPSVTRLTYHQKKPISPAGYAAVDGRRWTIVRKLTVGFLSLLILLGMISAVSLVSLNRLNRLNHGIMHTDIPLISACEKMIDVILGQELYAQRYRILASPDSITLFRAKDLAFHQLVDTIRAAADERGVSIDEIAQRHQVYSDTLAEGLSQNTSRSSPENFESRVKKQQEALIALIRTVAKEAELDQRRKTAVTTRIGQTAFRTLVALCGMGILLALTAAWLITRNISRAVKDLKIAFAMVSKGIFDYRPKITNNDELGDLAKAFVTMAGRLKRLEEANLDTSPLTRLPGGRAIEKFLKARVAVDMPVAFCMMDIDNFKAFNDRYGYAKGNELIQTTAAIIKNAVAKHGSGRDFVGHIGGDDFVLITVPERFRHTCQAIINGFDGKIPDLYDPPDRKRGYIIGENRQGQKTSFPLASISIAVVTNGTRRIESHIEFGEVAAELKEHAKSLKGSVLLVDRRNVSGKSCKDRKIINLENHIRVS